MPLSGRVPLICCVADALIIFLIAAFCLAPADLNPLTFIKLIAATIPLCVLVGLRGKAHTRNLIAGQDGWRRPAIEGFLVSLLFIIIISPILIVSEAVEEALITGSWPGFGYAVTYDWSGYFPGLFKNAFIVGMLGENLKGSGLNS